MKKLKRPPAQAAPTPSKTDDLRGHDWTKPPLLTGLDVAFGVSLRQMPPMSAIPEEFKNHNHPLVRFVSGLFFKGGRLPPVKAGIDATAAQMCIKGILCSFAPHHEHKEAAAAWLMSLWFEAPS